MGSGVVSGMGRGKGGKKQIGRDERRGRRVWEKRGPHTPRRKKKGGRKKKKKKRKKERKKKENKKSIKIHTTFAREETTIWKDKKIEGTALNCAAPEKVHSLCNNKDARLFDSDRL